MSTMSNIFKYSCNKFSVLYLEAKCLPLSSFSSGLSVQRRALSTCFIRPCMWSVLYDDNFGASAGQRLVSKRVLKSNSHQSRAYTNQNILKLSERGLWKDRFPDQSLGFEQDLLSHKQRVYAGFDPTADSLHIGNLLVIMALLHCREAGHTPLVLLGGFTSSLGDPAGRSDERPGIPKEIVSKNLARIHQTIQNIFNNHDKLFWKTKGTKPLPDAILLNNEEWLGKMLFYDFLPVLRAIKLKHLLRSKFIRDRLVDDPAVAPITVKEFLYQVVQAYDWLHLYDKYQCKIQVGGSDQFANMVVGHGLIRDARGDNTCTGLTVPLLLGPSGEKLSKSAGNSVWLSSDRTSYFDFYQYFLRRQDTEVEKLLQLLTLIPLKEIEKIMEEHQRKPEALTAQKKLAEAVTLLVHGERGLAVARTCTTILYHNQATALLDLSPSDLESLFSENLVRLSLEPGTTVMQAAMMAGCFKSERECERTILGGGFHINQYPAREPHMVLVPDAHILPAGYSLLRVGKKSFTLVAWNSYGAREAHS